MPSMEVSVARAQPPAVVDVLGIPIVRLDLSGVLDRVVEAIEHPRPTPVCLAYANAHTCNVASTDRTFRQALRRMDIVYLDGNGPRLAAWLAGTPMPRRMTGADWIHDLCNLCIHRGYRLYFLGARQGVAAAAADNLRRAHPGLEICGVHHGYFSRQAWQAIRDDIASLSPSIVLVGMASPAQEIWMLEVAASLPVPVIWGAGGVFDYTSGRLHRAPLWMRRLGLEWLGRLFFEPRRLLSRYALGVPLFLVRAIAWSLRARLQRLSHRARDAPPTLTLD